MRDSESGCPQPYQPWIRCPKNILTPFGWQSPEANRRGSCEVDTTGADRPYGGYFDSPPDDMMRGMQRMLATWPSRAEQPMTLAEWAPSVDIGESDTEFLIKAELPEVEKDAIKLNVEDGTLSISGERKVEKEEKGLKFHRVERAYGRFERAFGLPHEAEPDKISSEYKDGILMVHVPKNPVAKPAVHQIPVQ